METGFTLARAALDAIAAATGNGHIITLAASLRSLPVNGYANDEQIGAMQLQLDGLVEAIALAAEPAQPVEPPTPNADDGASLAAEPATDTAPSSEPPSAASAA